MSQDITSQTFQCVATAERLASARAFLRRFLAMTRWKGCDLDVLIAVGEVLQNIIRHGFDGGDPEGRIHMEVVIEKGVLKVLIEDDAPSSVPSGWASSGQRVQDGGLGLMMIHHIADGVEFAPTATGNCARLSFRSD